MHVTGSSGNENNCPSEQDLIIFTKEHEKERELLANSNHSMPDLGTILVDTVPEPQDIQECMHYPITFYAEMMVVIMYLHQALKQNDST